MSDVNWNMINNLVAKENQYLEAKDAPLDPVRMAWPFKTEEELEALKKWFKEQKLVEKKRSQESAGDALL